VKEQARIDPEAMIREVTRYLAAVDTFRAANCEPIWRPELESSGDPVVGRLAAYGQTPAASGS
jgi:hypothetical protein